MASSKRRKIEDEDSVISKRSKNFASSSSRDGPIEQATTTPSDKTARQDSHAAVQTTPDTHQPRDISKNDGESIETTFQDLGIRDELCEACAALNFKTPTPIQRESIPLALQGRDLIGLAETGSGKTAAFALPILQDLMDREQKLFALVLAPTRELAYQTAAQFNALGSVIRVRTAVIVGGMAEVEQAIALAKGPHVVVATPGRLLYHLESTKGFALRNLKYLVMDEADRLLDLNFGKEIDRILRELPKETRRTFLFSATMSSGVASLQRASLRNPVKVSVSNALMTESGRPKHTTVSSLLQHYLFKPHKDKDLYLMHLLTAPYAGHSAIIFSRTIHETSRLTHLLRALGLGAIPLHGELSQSARMSALNKFKAQSRDILVATDVAARGLDIPSVDLVINYDLPGDDTTYVHRVGRTARAGKSGIAVSLVSQYDVEVWLRIEKALGRKIDEMPGVEEAQVKILGERVGEAQRVAIRALRDEQEKKKGRGVKRKGKQGRDDKDREES